MNKNGFQGKERKGTNGNDYKQVKGEMMNKRWTMEN